MKDWLCLLRHCALALPLLLAGCGNGPDSRSDSGQTGNDGFDPLAEARATLGPVINGEAVVPSQCYTKTDGVANPCWTCHTLPHPVNDMNDFELQLEYSFSDVGLTNHWTNLFVDRSAEIAAIGDAEILEYVREDNYTPLMDNLSGRTDYVGWAPDLDYELGFDDEGFAADGSWWRAFRYKPFLGTFWPTNGSTDDVLIRLPRKFYTDTAGDESREIYKANLAILEAVMNTPPAVPHASIEREVEPIDENLVATDLDRDGVLNNAVTLIVGLPSHFVGAASDVAVTRFLYPEGTEFLHTVRYLDPDDPRLLSKRMKEVRYSIKYQFKELDAILDAYKDEEEDKEAGGLPVFSGTPEAGLANNFGWRYQGFIEDRQGRLRLQTQEEHLFCMGCHSTIGVTLDQSFGFPRKVPGAGGWGHQDLAGIADVPQSGHEDPEILTYFRRVGGGDEFRANTEILERFFPLGQLDESEVRRAASGGDQDIRFLVAPSRERALMLNKAYRALVKSQSFDRGRDTVVAPATNVHKEIVNGSTGLFDKGRVYSDGSIWLDWD